MATVDVQITSAAEWFVGEDKVLEFTIRDEANAVVDVSSWTLEWALRLTRHTPTTVLAKSGAAITKPGGGTDGRVRVAIARADTVALKAGTYYHGLARVNSGFYDVVAEGSAVLRKAAIR